MTRFARYAAVAALALVAPAAPAVAALDVGASAPRFVAQGAQGGRRLTVDLDRALRRGPVVLYFFPRAFTSGCTLESRAFAEAMPRFRAAGATVIGVSSDNVETLARFSTQECRAAFPMASATAEQLRAFDVTLAPGIASRTSYVIGRDRKVALVHHEMNPNDHVRLTLEAAQRLQAAPRARR